MEGKESRTSETVSTRHLPGQSSQIYSTCPDVRDHPDVTKMIDRRRRVRRANAPAWHSAADWEWLKAPAIPPSFGPHRKAEPVLMNLSIGQSSVSCSNPAEIFRLEQTNFRRSRKWCARSLVHVGGLEDGAAWLITGDAATRERVRSGRSRTCDPGLEGDLVRTRIASSNSSNASLSKRIDFIYRIPFNHSARFPYENHPLIESC